MRIINLDNDSSTYSVQGGVVIDLDAALERVRQDTLAEYRADKKVRVNAPWTKKGYYYRNGGGEGEGEGSKPKKGLSKNMKRGLMAAGMVAAAGSFAHSANELRKEYKAKQQEKKEREEYLKNLEKEPELTETQKQRRRAKELIDQQKKAQEAAKGSSMASVKPASQEGIAKANEKLKEQFSSEQDIAEMMTGGLFDDEPEDKKKK